MELIMLPGFSAEACLPGMVNDYCIADSTVASRVTPCADKSLFGGFHRGVFANTNESNCVLHCNIIWLDCFVNCGNDSACERKCSDIADECSKSCQT